MLDCKFLGITRGVSDKGNSWSRVSLLVPSDTGLDSRQIFITPEQDKQFSSFSPLDDVKVEFNVNFRGFAFIHSISK